MVANDMNHQNIHERINVIKDCQSVIKECDDKYIRDADRSQTPPHQTIIIQLLNTRTITLSSCSLTDTLSINAHCTAFPIKLTMQLYLKITVIIK